MSSHAEAAARVSEGTTAGPAVRITGLEHRYGQTAILGPLDLTVQAGTFLVLVGASGCGKSTLLRLIAGFESPTSGDVTISGQAPVPGHSAGVVFQQPRLFPWRRVGGNVDLALKYAGVAKHDRAQQREAVLHRVGLDGMSHRRIWEISGGQQQRVAIARALASQRDQTSLLLLDEPFSALDALTRERLQQDIRAVTTASGQTTVFVTHSADEAVFLGSRIVVLTRRPGRIALDVSVDLPRTDLGPDELRHSQSYLALRQEISHAIKAAAV